MSSIKCPNCGLTNFATATECKRCKQNLEARSYPYWGGNGPVAPPKPDWSKVQTVPDVPGAGVSLADYGDDTHTVGNILFAIYLGLSTIFSLLSLAAVLSASTSEVWKSVTDAKSRAYLPSFEASYYVALLGAVILLFGSVILFVRLCLRSRAFLTWVVIYLIAEFIFFALNAWLVYNIEGEMREKAIPQLEAVADQLHWAPYFSIIRILLTFIWFRYFTTSKRARSVFEY